MLDMFFILFILVYFVFFFKTRVLFGGSVNPPRVIYYSLLFIYTYFDRPMLLWVECSPMAQETGVQSQVDSY